MQLDVLVVGAGWAGLSCATALASSRCKVAVVEKGRGPGGRCATRRHEGWSFDHGAQYFTAASETFNQALRDWQQRGWVQPWEEPIEVFGPRPEHIEKSVTNQPHVRWVGVPGNNSVLKAIADDVDFFPNHRVQEMAWLGDRWRLELCVQGEVLHWETRKLVLTAPPKQCADLLGENHGLWSQLDGHPMRPTWALLVGFEVPSGLKPQAAFVNEGPIAWFAAQTSKPERGREAWVIHATPEWSEYFLEASAEVVEQVLLSAWEALVGRPQQPASFISAHRWRYAQSASPLNVGFLHDPSTQVWIGGDWCAGNRVEGAWVSGQEMALSLTK